MSLKTRSVSVLLIVATLVSFFFQDLVSVDVEISQVKLFDTFMNCYQDDTHQYVSSITQFSEGFCMILFPLNFKYFFTIFDLVIWNLWKKKPEYLWLIILDLNILDRFEADFQVLKDCRRWWNYLHILLCTVLSRTC